MEEYEGEKVKAKSKLASRKLWISIAAILASVGTTIAGFSTDNELVIIAGIICTVVSGAIYSICEALVDSSYAIDEEDAG